MIIVIFEFQPTPNLRHRYFELAELLRTEVEHIDGFVSVERFESVEQTDRFVSISTWKNIEAVQTWKKQLEHCAAQNEAKTPGLFVQYRIRVAEVFRDYSS